MKLIRTQTQGSTPCITDSNPLVINAEHVVLYEPSYNRLFWATEEEYQEDVNNNAGCNHLDVSEYEHAKLCTRVVFVTGKACHVLQSFESFDKAFTYIMNQR